MTHVDRLRLFGLRFLFAYALLYGGAIAVGLLPATAELSVAYMEAWLPLVNFTGRHVLGLEADIEYRMTGSGDTSFDWVLMVVYLGLAALVAGVWSAIARRSPARLELAPLVRSLVRHLVACNMIAYGAVKVFSSQFGDVEPQMLVRTFGEMSPMALLWSFMAYSDVYETFGGLAELTGGVLLLSRRTTTLGALVTIGVMSNVVALNYCYDVPVKLLSTHLLLAGFWLVAPDLRRVVDVFVRGRGVAPLELEPWPRTVRRRRAAMALKLAFIGGQATVLAAYFVEEMRAKAEPRDPLLGLYEIASFTRDGETLPLLLGDERVWRRVGIHEWALVVEPMTGKLEFRRLQHDPDARTLDIAPPDSPESTTSLVYSTTDDGTLELHGMDGAHRIDARLRRVQNDDFLLQNRGFHWVNEFPFNR